MFSATHVAVLFTQATKVLQRSMIMFEEKVTSNAFEEEDLDLCFTPASGINLSVMPSKKTITELPLSATNLTCYSSASTIEWVRMAQTLATVANIRTYLEATTVMVARLRREAVSASPTISRRRQQGQNFPILKQIVSGLKSLELVWCSKDSFSDVGTLWWDPAAVEADSLRGEMSSTMVGLDFGAYVVGLIVACGLMTDAVHCCGKWLKRLREWNTKSREDAESEATVTNALSLENNEAINLIMQAMMHLPTEASQRCMERVANIFAHAIPFGITPELKSLCVGILMVPGWAAYMLMEGTSTCSSIAGEVLNSVAALSRNLLSVYLEDESRFGHLCAEALCFIGILTNQLVQRAVCSDLTKSTLTVTSSAQRAVAVLRSLFNTFLQPLEENFTAFVARPGVSNALWIAFAHPFQCLVVERTLVSLSVSPVEASHMARICSAILRTAFYRLLLIVEALGAAELSKLSGISHTAHQQKRYKGMLQHSRGKVTMPLLNAIAEDRHLLLEDANMRSPSGHLIFKLHNGIDHGEGGYVVLLYLDNGVIHYSVSRRDRNFKVARGVEEIFKAFQS